MNLKKEMNFFDVFSIATGAMISSGIFILPGLAFSYVGPAVTISYFLAGIFALIGIFSVIELSTAMPKAGGDYYYISRTLGPMIGTVAGFFSWFALSLKSAFAIFGIARVIYMITGIDQLLVGLLICGIFVGLNIVGVKGVAKLEVLLVIGLLILMIIYVKFGILRVDTELLAPIFSSDLNKIFITSGFIFVSFGGLLNISSIAEEVKNPKKIVPIAMLSSIIVITIIYTLMLVVTVGILPANELSGSLTPIASASRIFMGEVGYIAINIAAILAFVTTALAGIMSASRYPMALSRDNLLPSFISKINTRFKTPVNSIVITGIFIAVSLVFPLEILVKVASTVVLTSYVLTNIAVIILRESRISNYKPSFKSPLYPLPQIISIIVFTYFIVKLGLVAAEVSGFLLSFSLIVYFLYGKKRSDKEYALLHIIEQVVDKELTSHSLEAELREIIKDRDKIGTDDFDHLVRDSVVIDIEDKINFRDLVEIVSKELEETIGEDRNISSSLLVKKESELTSVVSDFVAIPHLIFEDSRGFNLLLLRCKKGIYFSKKYPLVKAVFVFSGDRNNVDFHLRILSSIAYIVREDNFRSRWLEAKNENYIKDLLLLSKRNRS